ncbi:hypothetical protein ACMGGR_08035 [Erwinia sp. BNK-24-b]|uniref:hypothetical protein n=1 Tax=unclassified Erwinia TaxID=2622719 RepID=UPI0039BFBC2C
MSTPKITTSVEIMKNFKQNQIMSPDKKFEALQTTAGNSLLFSVGSDNAFYVTLEQVEHSTGWQKINLSTDQINKSFPGQSGLSCKDFDVAQSHVDGTLGLAMVLNDGNYDHLFLSLGNSGEETDWLNNVSWKEYPFDNPTKSIVIAGVSISETANQTQYIIVDILRDLTSPTKLISRYYLTKDATTVWQPHDVATDIAAENYSSCLGRQHFLNSPHQPQIDGVYTCGQIGGEAQLTFQPLYNEFNKDIAAAVSRLVLPGNLVPEAIAACRKKDLSTDLYVCSDGALYYFASSNQGDNAIGELIMTNASFTHVKKIYAAQSDNNSIVWGLNGNNEIFYICCQAGQETATPSAWSYPLAIVNNVDEFSPYINMIDDGNTFFVAAGNELQKFTKTQAQSLWRTEYILLPTEDITQTLQYNSSTTHILVTDENNIPLVGESVTISASHRVGVYINHLYYVIDADGIEMSTDQTGTLTIVEWNSELAGTLLTLKDRAGNVYQVDPSEKVMNKMLQLNSPSALKAAVIDDGRGMKTPLVDSNIQATQLQDVASSTNQLHDIYTSLSPQSVQNLLQAAVRTPVLSNQNAVVVEISDLFRWLKTVLSEPVIEIIRDEEAKIWHFVAHVEDEIYTAVLDKTEKVVGAMVWILHKISGGLDKLISYVQYVFAYDDIIFTHRVMKNVYIQQIKDIIINLNGMKQNVQNAFSAMQADVNHWADINEFTQTPQNQIVMSDAQKGYNSAPAQFGIHHFKGNINSTTGTLDTKVITEEIFKDLLNLLENEGQTLVATCEAIKTDIIDKIKTLSLSDIIKKFVAILVDDLLQTTRNIIDAAIDVALLLTDIYLAIITEKIEIPVLSYLYKELTKDDLSCLDVMCFIAAIPATITYKLTHSTAPFFASDSFSQGLLNATDMSVIRTLFTQQTTTLLQSGRTSLTDSDNILDGNRMRVFGTVAGSFALVGSVVMILSKWGLYAIEDTMLIDTRLNYYLTAFSAVGNVLYLSPNFATIINTNSHNWWEVMNSLLASACLVNSLIAIPVSKPGVDQKYSKAVALANTVIALLTIIPVSKNIAVNQNDKNYPSLVPESIANVVDCAAGIMDFPLSVTEKGLPKTVAIGVQTGLEAIYGICTLISGGINEAEH